MKRLILIVGLAVLISGCGYFMAGTWEDDPGNWSRAFGSTKPADVIVVHSKYWRSPHWSFEFRYFFEIAPNEELRAQIFRDNELQLLKQRSSEFSDAPAWFAPNPPERYEMWGHANAPRGHFRVIIDVETRTLFLTDYQL